MFFSLFLLLLSLSLLRIFKLKHDVADLILLLQLIHPSDVGKIRYYFPIQIYLTYRFVVVRGLAQNPSQTEKTGHPAV